MRTIEALALAIEAKDHTTHTHLQRVRTYAIEIAKQLHLGEEQVEALRAAALLHDIGKLAVPEQIINKPGKLTPEEFEKMKVHPIVGAEILERVAFPYPVAPIVRSHHERWDGTGYPEGLSGENIPIGARILGAVDCLDALASHRQYRPALPLAEAMEKVKEKSGTWFDPTIVEILETRYIELERLAQMSEDTAITMIQTFDYEAILLGLTNVGLDPSEQMNVWLSSSENHQWNPSEKSPETAWEAEIDKLMRAQASSADAKKRKESFDRVQEIAVEQAPFIYLVNRNALSAISSKVQGASPVIVVPQTYWNVERLSVK